jgi:hypothetical protein
MRKSALIAMCLINGRIVYRMEDADIVIRRAFTEAFPNADYDAWNTRVSDTIVQETIRNAELSPHEMDAATLIRVLGAPSVRIEPLADTPRMTDADLQRIGGRAVAVHFTTVGHLPEGHPYEEHLIVGEGTDVRELQTLVKTDVPALIAEIERLRGQGSYRL